MQTTLAAQVVYGEGVKHILCLWHVDRYGYIGSSTNTLVYIIDKTHNFYMTGLGKIGSNLSSLRTRWKSTRHYAFYCQSEILTPSKGEWQIFSTFRSPKNQILWILQGALWGLSRYNIIIIADYDKRVIYTVQTLMPTEMWALCYRYFQHGDTDTNMYLER